MATIEVNTSEVSASPESSERVSLTRPDSNSVVIDTRQEAFEEAATPLPPPPRPAGSPRSPTAAVTGTPRPAVVEPTVRDEAEEEEADDGEAEEDEEEEEEEPKKKKRSDADEKGARPVKGYLRERPEFASALRKTVPAPPVGAVAAAAAEEDDDGLFHADKPKKSKKSKKPAPKKAASPKKKKAESSDEESSSSDGSGFDEEADGDEGDEAAEGEDEEELSEEDEYVEKMKTIEQIKNYAKMGAVPPQSPTMAMPLKMLRKIRDYQESVVNETIGIGFIGLGWLELIGLVEYSNERWGHHLEKIIGMGLKLRGAKATIGANIHLYESVFKHIYRKLGMDKLKEAGPWAQMIIVTVQLLGRVHKHNVEREMAEQAATMANNPDTIGQSERLRRLYEQELNRRKQRPAETAAAAAEDAGGAAAAAPLQQQQQQQQTMTPVDEAVKLTDADLVIPQSPSPEPNQPIDMKQPIAEADKPVPAPPAGSTAPTAASASDTAGTEEAEADEEEEDDVIVTIPKTKRR